MNQLVSKIYALLETHALINEEVSGFRFLSSTDFSCERKLFFEDLEEQLSLKFDGEDLKKIRNLSELISYVSKYGSAFQA